MNMSFANEQQVSAVNVARMMHRDDFNEGKRTEATPTVWMKD